jgi:hypothetical protein
MRTIRKKEKLMTEETNVLSYLKNRGIITPSGWKVSDEYDLTQLADLINRVSVDRLDMEDVRRILNNSNIQY